MEHLPNPEAAPPLEGAETLFRVYGDMVYRLAFLRTGSAADADDVVQEVFLRCLKSPRQWRSAEHQKAWFLTVTLNCTKSLLTAAFRRHTVPERDDLAVEMEERSEVYGEVLKLPVRYRTVVHLFYYEGYKVSEIAQIMGAGEGTVKSWLFRARDMLRESLKGVYPDV
ncbi:MAG: RNA polymerase sigma factor [Clostridia bacterium]|nr:RNA polymerase sigma factor [Clostridia bacterium]